MLEQLIRKRHEGPAWIVIEEVGNGTGYNVKRHADALAIGIWPSRGYEIHGYEVKRSRGDVQKELDDPSKADAVGKYCDYWWLVIEDLKIIDGLVIPATWGILVPKNKVLRIHRKAPKRDATPVNRSFVAAVVRKVTDGWVPKHVHDELKKTAKEEATKELENRNKYARDDSKHELEELRGVIKRFQEMTGVVIAEAYSHEPDGTLRPKSAWELEGIGEAVKAVVNIRRTYGHDRHNEPILVVERELMNLERDIDRHEAAKQSATGRAFHLRNEIERMRDELNATAEESTPREPPQLELLEGGR